MTTAQATEASDLVGGVAPRVDPRFAGLRPDPRAVMPHRQRAYGDEILVTNDFGHWALLGADVYRRYLAGGVSEQDPEWAALARGGFLAGALDTETLTSDLRRRMSYLRAGPNLHVVVVTLRCDHSCRYCHASRVPMQRSGFDMDAATAEKVVDRIFEVPNRHALIEFQGGEPLANFPVVEHIVRYAREKNHLGRKRLSFALVTNMTFMDDEKLDWLIANRVEICTSLDGPADLHDGQRRTRDRGAFARATHWIRRINERFVAEGLDPSLYRVEALLTATREALPRYKEIIDTYVDVGCRAIFLRALNPFGFASTGADTLGYPIEEWLEFYRRSVDYILELNLGGVEILERNASIFLSKMLTPDDPNYLDIRSPCGAGIGQMAWSHDGRAFTCDEGRMVHQMGDDLFAMGDAHTDHYQDLVTSPAVRSLLVSSTLDALPGCHTCAFKPYCGVCPVTSYSEQGSLAGRVVDSFLCQKHMGIQDYLVGLLRRAREEPALDAALKKWITSRPREHFVHEGHV